MPISKAAVLDGAIVRCLSFNLNAALLSRAQVLILTRFDATTLSNLLHRAEEQLTARFTFSQRPRRVDRHSRLRRALPPQLA